ncbi:hypothetical protein [Candidatus Thiodiazotropha sp. CDECU1]|uniref:hypothetical protein n=1 Tax=Candidatus Thiodiazotropha sp. CDECU1 TaxID=3065865 RepID=UPI00292ED279|nr:hypothetical protein [Candidatus Thiodiazotropha sp. CDECU1]
MFKDNWIKKINSRDWIHRDISLTEPSQLHTQIVTILETTAKDAHDMTNNGDDEHRILEHTKHRLVKPHLENIRVSYSAMYTAYKALVDERRQEAKADMVERIRYLIFRILTAIGIAVVVMWTYYLAGEWGIELPMTRAVLGATF